MTSKEEKKDSKEKLDGRLKYIEKKTKVWNESIRDRIGDRKNDNIHGRCYVKVGEGKSSCWNFFHPPIRSVVGGGVENISSDSSYLKPNLSLQRHFIDNMKFPYFMNMERNFKKTLGTLEKENTFDEAFSPTMTFQEFNEEVEEVYELFDDVQFHSHETLEKLSNLCGKVRENMMETKKRALKELENILQSQIDVFERKVLEKVERQKEITEKCQKKTLLEKLERNELVVMNEDEEDDNMMMELHPFNRLIMFCEDALSIVLAYVPTSDILMNFLSCSSYFFSFVKDKVPLCLSVTPEVFNRFPLDEIYEGFRIERIHFIEDSSSLFPHDSKIDSLRKIGFRNYGGSIHHDTHQTYHSLKLKYPERIGNLVTQHRNHLKEIKILELEDCQVVDISLTEKEESEQFYGSEYRMKSYLRLWDIFEKINECKFLRRLYTLVLPSDITGLVNLTILVYPIDYFYLDTSVPDVYRHTQLGMDSTRLEGNYQGAYRTNLDILKLRESIRKRQLPKLEILVLVDTSQLGVPEKTTENPMMDFRSNLMDPMYIRLLEKLYDTIPTGLPNLNHFETRVLHNFESFSEKFVEFLCSKVKEVNLYYFGEKSDKSDEHSSGMSRSYLQSHIMMNESMFHGYELYRWGKTFDGVGDTENVSSIHERPKFWGKHHVKEYKNHGWKDREEELKRRKEYSSLGEVGRTELKEQGWSFQYDRHSGSNDYFNVSVEEEEEEDTEDDDNDEETRTFSVDVVHRETGYLMNFLMKSTEPFEGVFAYVTNKSRKRREELEFRFRGKKLLKDEGTPEDNKFLRIRKRMMFGENNGGGGIKQHQDSIIPHTVTPVTITVAYIGGMLEDEVGDKEIVRLRNLDLFTQNQNDGVVMDEDEGEMMMDVWGDTNTIKNLTRFSGKSPEEVEVIKKWESMWKDAQMNFDLIKNEIEHEKNKNKFGSDEILITNNNNNNNGLHFTDLSLDNMTGEDPNHLGSNSWFGNHQPEELPPTLPNSGGWFGSGGGGGSAGGWDVIAGEDKKVKVVNSKFERKLQVFTINMMSSSCESNISLYDRRAMDTIPIHSGGTVNDCGLGFLENPIGKRLSQVFLETVYNNLPKISVVLPLFSDVSTYYPEYKNINGHRMNDVGTVQRDERVHSSLLLDILRFIATTNFVFRELVISVLFDNFSTGSGYTKDFADGYHELLQKQQQEEGIMKKNFPSVVETFHTVFDLFLKKSKKLKSLHFRFVYTKRVEISDKEGIFDNIGSDEFPGYIKKLGEKNNLRNNNNNNNNIHNGWGEWGGGYGGGGFNHQNFNDMMVFLDYYGDYSEVEKFDRDRIKNYEWYFAKKMMFLPILILNKLSSSETNKLVSCLKLEICFRKEMGVRIVDLRSFFFENVFPFIKKFGSVALLSSSGKKKKRKKFQLILNIEEIHRLQVVHKVVVSEGKKKKKKKKRKRKRLEKMSEEEAEERLVVLMDEVKKELGLYLGDNKDVFEEIKILVFCRIGGMKKKCKVHFLKY